MKRVLIIHTGGTFGMTPAEPDKTLQPGKIERHLDEYIPSIRELAEITIKIPFNLDSSNMGPYEWKRLYTLIRAEMNDYDGMVIIHGTDTLVYSAAALSFLLLDLKKPLILTGAQRPLSALRSDARGNLINSVELATYDIPEVLICFGNKLFRGNRTKKVSIESFQSFDSPNYPPLATIGLGVHLNSHYILREKQSLPLKPVFDSGILSLRLFPGLKAEIFLPLLNERLRAVVIDGFGAGNLPAVTDEWFDFIALARQMDKLVFVGSQSAHGRSDLSLYAAGRLAQKAGASSLTDMTREAALVKLMLLLGNMADQDRVLHYMLSPLAGESGETD
jgi:L-asparaginase